MRVLKFQSTRPSRASTFSGCAVRKKMVDFNPQGPRGPRPQVTSVAAAAYTISIHKALAGLDALDYAIKSTFWNFNPQGPRGPRPAHTSRRSMKYNFNPQGPRGPRPGCCTPTICALRDFNPQGPRGPRPNEGFVTDARQIFQSTRPSRASTLHRQLSHNFFKISIHKALAGLDAFTSSSVIPCC